MKKMMSVFFALVLSSMAFANARVDIKFEGTSSGIEVSVTGANQDKSGKNDNTVKVYKKGSEVASFKLSNGSGSTLVQGVKCDEQIVVTVFNVQNEDGGKGGKHTETSKLRRKYSGSNCPKDSEPTPPPKKKTNISLSATGTASGVEVTITGVASKNDREQIEVMVPLSEMFGYSTSLRSRSQGRASFSMQFKEYQALDKKLTKEILLKRGIFI